MQSEQFNYFPILMQALLAIGFVVATILISGKLGPKRKSAIKDKNLRMTPVFLFSRFYFQLNFILKR